jgi:hypothetical protein
MKAGTIPVFNDQLWICNLSEQFENIKFHEFMMQLSSIGYISILIVKPEFIIDNYFIGQEIQIRDEIKKLKSIDEFRTIWADSNFSAYEIAVDDIKNKTSPIRILARIKDAYVYKFISNPAVTGIQYLNAFFPDNDAFNKSVKILEEEFEVLRNDNRFNIHAVEQNDIFSDFTHIFDIIGMKSIETCILKPFINNDNKNEVLDENEINFFSLLNKYPILNEIFNLIVNFESILEFYEKLKGRK